MDLYDLGTDRLTWGRLWRIIQVQPATSASALAWAKAREKGAYPIDIELGAGQFDALAVANWQRSKKAGNAGSAPKPIPRPSKVQALRGQARDQLIERGRAFLRRQRPKPPPRGGDQEGGEPWQRPDPRSVPRGSRSRPRSRASERASPPSSPVT